MARRMAATREAFSGAAIPHDNYGIMVARNQPFLQVGPALKPSQLLISGFGVRVPGGAPYLTSGFSATRGRMLVAHAAWCVPRASIGRRRV
jgi:hypothetical protein